jgi:hypothetical protein
MRMWGLCAVTFAAVGVAGCGSTTRTTSHNVTTTVSSQAPLATSTNFAESSFVSPGMRLHFKYPSVLSFHQLKTGDPTAPEATLTLNDPDFLAVTRFINTYKTPITEQTIAKVKSDLDHQPTKSFKRPMSATIAGRPAVEYPSTQQAGQANGVTDRQIYIPFESDEYELECHSTSAQSSEIAQACAQMLQTIQFTISPS